MEFEADIFLVLLEVGNKSLFYGIKTAVSFISGIVLSFNFIISCSKWLYFLMVVDESQAIYIVSDFPWGL